MTRLSLPAKLALGCLALAAVGVVGLLGLGLLMGGLAPRRPARPAPLPPTSAQGRPQAAPAVAPSASPPLARPDSSWRDLSFEQATAKCDRGPDSVTWTITLRNSNPATTYNQVRYKASYFNEGELGSGVTREGTFQARIPPSWRGPVTFTDPVRLPRRISRCGLFLFGGS